MRNEVKHMHIFLYTN